MKKAILLLLGFTACIGDRRIYVNHTGGQYSIADDTLIVQDDLIIIRTGYQKIRDGKLLPKEFNVRQWSQDSPDAPVIRFDRKHAYWNNTIYRKLP